MSRLKCICGNSIYSSGEASYEFTLIKNDKINIIGDLISENKINATQYFDMVNEYGINIICCKECGRMWIERKECGKSIFKAYQAELSKR